MSFSKIKELLFLYLLFDLSLVLHSSKSLIFWFKSIVYNV